MPSTPVVRRRRAALAAGAAGALVVALAACTSPAPTVSPAPSADPSASAEPIFASDEEALAAAVAAHEAYLAMNDAIISDGGGTERILAYTTPEYGAQRIDELAAFVSSGLRSTGRTTFDTVSLAEYAESEQPPRISMYACVDVSGTRLINSAGVDVTPADRDSRVPVLLSFEGGPGSVLVSGSQLWSGDNFC
ncbi:hypothetical protein ACFPPE_01660 [Agromyces tardus]|nr:hypothetical protein [Agromyces tardus]